MLLRETQKFWKQEIGEKDDITQKWTDGYLVNGNWNGGNAELYADNGNVDNTNPYNGPRQKFLTQTNSVFIQSFVLNI